MKPLTIATLAACPIGLVGLLSEVKWVQFVFCFVGGSILAVGWYVDMRDKAKEIGGDE